MSDVTPEEQQETPWYTKKQNLLIVLLGLFLFTASMALAIFLTQDGDDDVVDVDSTPFPTLPAEALVIDEPVIQVVDETQTITVTVGLPETIFINGRSFPIQPQRITADGVWALGAGDQTAVWLYGSIVNYIVGIPDTNSNRALLEGLELGDTIQLQKRDAEQLQFDFTELRTVAPSNRDVFAQNSPRITLVLLGSDGAERIVAQADYRVPEATDSDSNLVELGQLAQLDDIQLTVNGTTYIPDHPQAPDGFAFLIVDYQVQNIGLSAFDTSDLQLSLIDELGNQYVLNPLASQVGGNPPIGGFINSGQTVQVVAGYQLPIGLVSSSLNWVATRKSSGNQVYVDVPFTGRGSAQGLIITMQSATISNDFTSLTLTGGVTNNGTQPTVISAQDIKLGTVDGTNYPIFSTNPAFPWSIAPGQTVQYALTFQRPNQSTATFSILTQEFQLSNLR